MVCSKHAYFYSRGKLPRYPFAYAHFFVANWTCVSDAFMLAVLLRSGKNEPKAPYGPDSHLSVKGDYRNPRFPRDIFLN